MTPQELRRQKLLGAALGILDGMLLTLDAPKILCVNDRQRMAENAREARGFLEELSRLEAGR